jgi:hypothetical protein
MKKWFPFIGLYKLIVSLGLFSVTCFVSGQTQKEQSYPIPENVNKIFQTSCMPCHGSDGGLMSTAKLNFSKWVEYNSEKKTEKALKICSVLNDAAMPPQRRRKSNPELIPTAEQIQLICKWAESLKPSEAKK